MNASLPLDQMSTEEKLAALEAIWGDLSRNARITWMTLMEI